MGCLGKGAIRGGYEEHSDTFVEPPEDLFCGKDCLCTDFKVLKGSGGDAGTRGFSKDTRFLPFKL